MKLFLIIFGFLSNFQRSSFGADPKCLQIDLMFALSISNTTDPVYYNTTVKSFVKSIVDAFSTLDEVDIDSRQFARFSLLQSAGWISQYVAPFENRTRKQVEKDLIEPLNFDIVAEHDGPMIEEQLSRSVWMLQGDWNDYGYTTITKNRVLILITDRVNYEDDYNKEMYLQQVHGRWPIIFGVGMPGKNGNFVADDIASMVELVNGHSDRAFKTIDDAKNSTNGILAQISKMFECPTVACSGFGFIFEDADMNWVDGKIFMDATVQLISDLNSSHNGFDVQDSFGIHYSPMISDADTAIRFINYYQLFTGFFGDFQNYTRATIFDLMLQIIDSGMYTNYGFFILAQTDTDWNYTYSRQMAYEVASRNVPVYVLDGSSSAFNTQELFKIVTKKPERLINMSSILDTDSLVAQLRKTLVPEFKALGCFPIPPTIFPPNCGGVIFIAELTKALSDAEKSNFFDVVDQLSAVVPKTLEFAFAEFGSSIYFPINLQNYSNFKNQLYQLRNNFTTTLKPNGSISYLSKILQNLLDVLTKNSPKKFTVLLMAESELIGHPTSAFKISQSIAALETNIYVLDYSNGNIPSSIFSTLTSNKLNHVVNGKFLTSIQIVTKFASTFLFDVNNGNC